MRKQSKRVAITKESIEVAYLDLLEENHERKITVKDVCERAGVNRTTFYKYYEDGGGMYAVSDPAHAGLCHCNDYQQCRTPAP